MSILAYPLRCERLARYLEIDGDADVVTAFVKRLSKNRIFDEDLEWFRHELVKKCFEDRLGNKKKREHHQRAAEFFQSLIEEKDQGKQEAPLSA